jgi:hypothetical protein
MLMFVTELKCIVCVFVGEIKGLGYNFSEMHSIINMGEQAVSVTPIFSANLDSAIRVTG